MSNTQNNEDDLFGDFQDVLNKMQKNITSVSYKGSSGAGLIEAEVNGKGDLTSIKVSSSLDMNDIKTPEDIKTLIDLCVVAVKKAQESASNSIVNNIGNIFDGGKGIDFENIIKMAKNVDDITKKAPTADKKPNNNSDK
jgi:DNA-binding protein YbaB